MENGRGLHVVFIADIPTTGGATDCLVELVGCLVAEHGVRCTVYTAQGSDLNDRLAAVGAGGVGTGHGAFLTTISRTAWKKPISFVKRWLIWKRDNAHAVGVAESAIDFDSVDIIHSNLPRNDIGMILAGRHGLPHVCHLRENSFEGFKLISLKPSPEKYLANGSDALVAVSESVKRNWVRRGMDASKLRVIYDGISAASVAAYARARQARRPDPQGRVRCIFLGGYYGVKGLSDVLGAVGLLTSEERSRLLIEVYGSGLESREGQEAARLVKERGLSDVVELHGYADDVPSLLGGYDVGLACSKAEAFGRIILEYRAAGLAVVAARSGSFPELVRGGEDGLLYDVSDPSHGLAETLRTLIADEGFAARLANAPHPIRTERDVAREVLTLYDDVLASRGRGDDNR